MTQLAVVLHSDLSLTVVLDHATATSLRKLLLVTVGTGEAPVNHLFTYAEAQPLLRLFNAMRGE